MRLEELAKKYVDARNRQDVGVLELMHPGAAYYDAFWVKSCVGRDLAQWLQDSMDEKPKAHPSIGRGTIGRRGPG
jgi:hypothetical protein